MHYFLDLLSFLSYLFIFGHFLDHNVNLRKRHRPWIRRAFRRGRRCARTEGGTCRGGSWRRRGCRSTPARTWNRESVTIILFDICSNYSKFVLHYLIGKLTKESGVAANVDWKLIRPRSLGHFERSLRENYLIAAPSSDKFLYRRRFQRGGRN